jgi:hypothetical protein
MKITVPAMIQKTVKPLSFAFCLLLAQLTLAQHQVPEAYFRLAERADSLYRAKAYKAATEVYTQAFKANGWLGFMPELYGAARAWAMIGNADSAFRKIDRVMTYGTYEDKVKVPAEPAFATLRKDPRWNTLVLARAVKAEPFSSKHQPLRARLDSIYREDQKYRLMMDSVAKKHGFESEQVRSLWAKMAAVDSVNLIKVKAILDRYGWLGVPEVGQQGNSTLFLVIQHADSATQVQYLPVMRKAVKEGKAEASQLALLEDRVALRQGRKQIYGSQVSRDPQTGQYSVLPLEDPDNVDKRRAAMGLPPLADYVKHWGMTWNAEAYKRQQAK